MQDFNMAQSSVLEIVAPAKLQISVVWDYFGIQKDKEDISICRSCCCPVTAKNGNTLNLLAHLKANHDLLYPECRQVMSNKPQIALQRTKEIVDLFRTANLDGNCHLMPAVREEREVICGINKCYHFLHCKGFLANTHC